MKRIILSMYLMVSLLCFLIPFQGSAHATVNETPVLLKVNDYYVLYTNPKAPYVDAQNRLMIPLRSISELLGAKIEYNTKVKTAIIKMNEKTVQFQLNSKAIIIDGEKHTMDTVPVLYKSAIFIPLASLSNNLNIQSNWDRVNKIYQLTGVNLMQTDMIKNCEDLDRQENAVASNNAFVPKSFKYNSYNHTVTIKSKNITGTDLPKGVEDVHPYFIFEKSTQFDTINRERPAVKKEQMIENTWTLHPSIINNKIDNLQYILVKGRLYK